MFCCSYADSVETYLDEEELRYYMPLKEYLAYCESLRLAHSRTCPVLLFRAKLGNSRDDTHTHTHTRTHTHTHTHTHAHTHSTRGMVRRHDLLEKRLERAESTLSAKAEAKATVQREVVYS